MEENDMSYENVLYETRDGIGLLTLNRPEALNSLNVPLMNDIRSVLKRVAEDPEIRVLVMTGAGQGFCSGADLTALGKPGDNPPDPNMSIGEFVSELMKAHFNPLVLELYRLEKPVVAAVNGVTAGGGVGMALTADLVIAARSAYFVQVFGPKLGIVPDMGTTWHLPRLLGRARSLGLALSGDRLPAEQAAQWGLIWKCVDDEALMDEVMTVAQKLAQGPTKAYGYIKKAISESGRNNLEEQLDFERQCQLVLCSSHDFMEGVSSFMEKRKPHFKGF